MEKIESFDFVLQYLKSRVTVCTIKGRQITTYRLSPSGTVTVNSGSARYSISFEDFTELFGSSQFYLHTGQPDGIDTDKDDEYYTWKHKGVN